MTRVIDKEFLRLLYDDICVKLNRKDIPYFDSGTEDLLLRNKNLLGTVRFYEYGADTIVLMRVHARYLGIYYTIGYDRWFEFTPHGAYDLWVATENSQ